MKKIAIATALIILLTLTLATPAFAQSLTFTSSYEIDGTINLQKQAGHLCNTGAEIKQTIVGSGTMDKTQSISMIEGRIMMEDDNNWVAGATPLTVTTVWELCMPAKHVFTDDWDEFLGMLDSNALLEEALESALGTELTQLLTSLKSGDPVPPIFGYIFGWHTNMADILSASLSSDILAPEILAPFSSLEVAEALTDQIWAVQVQADSGFSGNLYQNGIAANGGYKGNISRLESSNTLDYTSTEDDWRKEGWASSFVFGKDKYGQYVPMVGPDFVGSYFNLEQHARTSQGTQRRYISLSSPWSHAYLTEDMSVVGKSDIKDTLALNNLPAGADMPGLWWDLF